jgi:ubiquinone/menaquinone biosynthesis C-methylase UbiE
MSLLDTLSPHERARQLRHPMGELGLAIADFLSSTNRAGNVRAVADLGLKRGDRVLEVGCGLGALASTVVNEAEDVIYAGLDSSLTMITAARERNADLILAGSADFHLAQAEEMPLGDELFTKVFSIGVIHFWDDPVRALTEVRRVMCPGASMVMGCLGPERAPVFARKEYGFNLHTPAEWRTFATAAHFRDMQVEVLSIGLENGPQIVHMTANV